MGVLITAGVVVSVICHLLIRQYFIAVAVSSIFTPFAYVSVNQAIYGPGAQDGIALIIGFFIVLPFSLVLGLMVRVYRDRTDRGDSD